MPEVFSASRASRLRNCHASADLARAIPHWVPPVEDPDADNAANRGSEMHGIFARVMSLPLSDARYLSEAMQYVFDVKKQRRFKQLVETEEVAEWLPSKPTTTADLVLYLQDELHIFDLKTGRIHVDVTDNDQMFFYAATYLKYAPRAKEVHIHIVQPWVANMEAQVVPVDDLIRWMLECIRHDDLISQGDLTFGPGDHCLFCPANPHSRSAKGSPSCPVMLDILYPQAQLDDAALLDALDKE